MLRLWTSRAHLLHHGHGQRKSVAKLAALDVIAKKRITCSWPHKLVINSMPAHLLMPSGALLQSQSRVLHPNSAEATTMMCFLLGCRVRGPVCLLASSLYNSALHMSRDPNWFELCAPHCCKYHENTESLQFGQRFQLFLAASRGSVASSVVVSFSPVCIQNTASDSFFFSSTSWGVFFSGENS